MMCSWLLSECIDKYNREGSNVFVCLMDCTKAFNTVSHSKLFVKLIDRKIPASFVRLLLFRYSHQTAQVTWNGTNSKEFPITNGVRQGAVLSPVLFCLYMDGLMKLCKASGHGCFIGGFYGAIYGYADDLLLASPSRSGLQELVDLASNHATEHNISFSTDANPVKSKTKTMVMSASKRKSSPAPIRLNGSCLPWVYKAKYLSCSWSAVRNGHHGDIIQKKATFISNIYSISQEFPLAHP